MRRKIEREPGIIADYIAGLSMNQVAAKHGVGFFSVHKILHRAGVPVRGRGSVRHHALNEHAFDVLTPEARYWLGFLYADGHVSTKRPSHPPILQVCLSVCDIGHLEKLKLFPGSSHKLIRGVRTNTQCQICSRTLGNRLLELGMHRKSLERVPPAELAMDRDFWRGVVDGDGYLHDQARNPSLSLVGGSRLLTLFAEFCRTICPQDALTVAKCSSKNLHRVAVHTSGAVAVVTYLYSDATVYLDRKMEIATRFAAHRFSRRRRYYSPDDDAYIRENAGIVPWVEIAERFVARASDIQFRARKLLGCDIRHKKERTVDRQRRIAIEASTHLEWANLSLPF